MSNFELPKRDKNLYLDTPDIGGYPDMRQVLKEQIDLFKTLDSVLKEKLTPTLDKYIESQRRSRDFQKESKTSFEAEVKLREQSLKTHQAQLAIDKQFDKLRTNALKNPQALSSSIRQAELLAQRLDLFDKKARKYIIDGVQYSSEEMKKLLSGDLSGSGTGKTLSSIRQRAIDKRVITGDDGIFSASQVIQHIARGDFGAAVGEVFQHSARFERVGSRAILGGQSLAERGIARGGLAGAGMKGIGSLLTGAGEAFSTPALLLTAALNAPRIASAVWDQTLGKSFNYYNQTRRLGMVTGEGFGAGVASRAEAARIGWNPTDLISMKTATEIVGGVRGQGFRGGQARAMEESIKNIVNTLGIDWKTALEGTTLAVRQSDMSLADFEANMKTLNSTAKAAGASVNSVADNFKSLAESVATQGTAAGVSRAIQVTPALQTALSGLKIGKDEGGALGTWAGSNLTALAEFGYLPGHNILAAGSHPEWVPGELQRMYAANHEFVQALGPDVAVGQKNSLFGGIFSTWSGPDFQKFWFGDKTHPPTGAGIQGNYTRARTANAIKIAQNKTKQHFREKQVQIHKGNYTGIGKQEHEAVDWATTKVAHLFGGGGPDIQKIDHYFVQQLSEQLKAEGMPYGQRKDILSQFQHAEAIIKVGSNKGSLNQIVKGQRAFDELKKNLENRGNPQTTRQSQQHIKVDVGFVGDAAKIFKQLGIHDTHIGGQSGAQYSR